MDRLSTLIPRALQKHGLKGQADASVVVHNANLWLSAHEAPEGTKAIVLKDGTLSIEVTSSTAGQECNALSEELLDFLKKQYPDVRISYIRVVREHEKAHQAI